MSLVGHEGIAYVTKEATPGQRADVSGADAVSYDKIEIKPKVNLYEKKEHTGTASSQGHVKGRIWGTGSIEGEIKLNQLGTEPECGALFEGGVGKKEILATSLYMLLSRGSTVPTYQIVFELGIADGAYHCVQINHVVFTKLTLEQVEDTTATFKAEFEFADTAGVFATVKVDGAHAAGGNVVQLVAGHGRNVREGAQFLAIFQDETNGGAGYTITDVTGDVVTVTPALAGPLNDLDQVKVLVPNAAHDGDQIPATESVLVLDGATDLKFVKYTLVHETGFKLINKEAGEKKPTRAVRGKRNITGEVSFIIEDDNTRFLGDYIKGDTLALNCRMGPPNPGEHITSDTPKVTVTEAWSMEVPDDDAASQTIAFKAERHKADDDEWRLEAA